MDSSRRTPSAHPGLAVLPDAGCSAGPLTGGMTAQAATELAHVLKALADPARLRLLSLIADSPTAAACVCDLTEPLGLSQPTVSHHLKVLVDAGLLDREKRGVWAWYSAVPGALDAAVSGLPGADRLVRS
ncbi:ArsR/SmtB family transcription factor [Modestobacter sp. Leaf380]|uniref:ArsR/SmtB family transcription factor n=1 Tax=Modestobacter sp. Leaf380 TaxID=1736356 RepID=UPI000B053DD4